MTSARLATVALCATLAAAPVHSDACSDEIAALFSEGGAADPFSRGNRRETTVERQPDGSVAANSDVLWDGPIRSINCTVNGCFMAIGNETWSGSSFDGPWTSTGSNGIEDPEGFVRATLERLAASVQEPECLGETDLDGKSTLLYRFFSQTEPNEYGSWWGGRYSYWIDPGSNRLLGIELAEGIASWAPEPKTSVQVTTITYDDTISVTRPE